MQADLVNYISTVNDTNKRHVIALVEDDGEDPLYLFVIKFGAENTTHNKTRTVIA